MRMRRARIASTIALGCALLAAAPALAQAPEPKIVGGHGVSIDDHPWQAFVAIFRDGFESDCGGSIRDATHIVTAAHCVVDDESSTYPVISPPGDVFVGYGSANVDTLYSNLAEVAAITVDPRYKRDLDAESYDDAILTLANPIPFGASGHAPQAIDYATSQELNDAWDGGGFVTGWGTTSEGGDTPPDGNLRGAAIDLQPDESCDFEYGGTYVADVMICAGGGGTDTCQGDSGGPLTVDVDPTAGVHRKLVGITSGGHGCGRPGVPGYYTWVQSPQILQVLAAPTPAAAPGAPPASSPVVSGVARVGRVVTCNAPALADASPARYLWYRHTQAAGYAPLGTGHAITLPLSALGTRVGCDVRYEGAGGFVYKESPLAAFAGPVGAATFFPDTMVVLSLPSSRIPSSGPLPVTVSNHNNFLVKGSLAARSVAKLRAKPSPRRATTSGVSFSAKPHRAPTVRLGLPQAIRTALERKGSVKLELRAVVRDPAGRTRTVTRTVTVRKR